MYNNRKKRSVTLIEIMIVIFLIGLIGGVLAINMKGSVDKGKEFQTHQNCAKIYDILMMEYATGDRSLDQIVSDYRVLVKNSPFCKNGDKVLKDGWGHDLIVEIQEGTDDIKVYSKKIPINNA
ncbi:MAG: type II secretion system protein [Victivallaceae bacterium]